MTLEEQKEWTKFKNGILALDEKGALLSVNGIDRSKITDLKAYLNTIRINNNEHHRQ